MTLRIFRHVCLEVHSVSILQQYGKHVLLWKFDTDLSKFHTWPLKNTWTYAIHDPHLFMGMSENIFHTLGNV